MRSVECANCGKTFGAQRKTAVYCSTKCRVAATRARAREAAPPPRRDGAKVIALPATPAATSEYSLTAVTRVDLEAAGRLRTPAGLLALKLAEILDSGVQDTGSSMAALGRQYLATVEKALDGAAVAETPLEKIRREREMKAG